MVSKFLADVKVKKSSYKETSFKDWLANNYNLKTLANYLAISENEM